MVELDYRDTGQYVHFLYLADLLADIATALRVIVVGLAMWILGRVAARVWGGERWGLAFVAFCFVSMAIARGYYWDIFPRTDGPFTANRLSAIAVFGALYVAAFRLTKPKSNASR